MKKYNKKAVMHLLKSYVEFQKKLMKLAETGLNPFEFTEKYDEQIRTAIVLMINPNANYVDENYNDTKEMADAIYEHVENSIREKRGTVNYRDLLKYLESELLTNSENILKIVE